MPNLRLSFLFTLVSIQLFLVSTVNAANTSGKQLNTNPSLEALGIPKDLPRLALSELGQTKHFVEHVTKSVTKGEQTKSSEYFLVHSTDDKGRMHLEVRYDESKLSHSKQTIDQIRDMAFIEYKLRQFADSYDKNSVQVIELGGGKTQVNFRFSKFALPQELAYFRHMKAEVIVEAGKVMSMLIRNSKPFQHPLGRVQDYRQTISFEQLSDGRYVIQEKQITASGQCDKQDCQVVLDIKPVAIYDEAMGTIIRRQDLLYQLADPRYQHQNVKLERVFPLFGDTLRRKGIDLPNPFGVSLAYRNQDTEFDFTSFSVFGLDPQIVETFVDPAKTHAVVNTESTTLRGDVYILPFWNVFGLVGKLDVHGDVDSHFKGVNTCIGVELGGECIGQPINVPQADFHVPIHLQYDLVGIGTTISIGYKNFFASVTGTFTKTKRAGAKRWGGSIFTAQPMLGYQMPQHRAQFFVGAEYQGIDDFIDGEVNIGGVEMAYDVGIRTKRWAGLVGFNKQLGKNFNLTGIISKGKTRAAATLNLGYRF
ncbi:hypothetical protein [Paraferrimonas sedimenticola]|uniref:Haemolysin activator HlyB C-terminal domain-containing protein n=1 Tax=Paraferrimonas sedimenticola TaxID=375674 RepID=A0AA37VVI3_9GAMM|nr:hypothetical protein [Paraferrimonas sedimenticola]GLP96144.1 hypothetical protein GCM10007895_14500 [Paraferrimonas sedimenticola]